MARSRTYKTEGVVLKHMALGEADRIVTLFSRDEGKLRVVARGVRKTTSKLRGHLEPLTHIYVSVSKGKSLDSVIEAQIIQPYRGIREDLQPIAEGVYVAELVDNFSVESASDPPIFDMLLSVLTKLQERRNSMQAIRHFETQILARSGFGPELFRCVECGVVLEEENHVFSLVMGGIVCPGCKVLVRSRLLDISVNTIKVLRYFQRNPELNSKSLDMGSALAKELSGLMYHYIGHIVERDLKSVKFLNLVNSRT